MDGNSRNGELNSVSFLHHYHRALAIKPEAGFLNYSSDVCRMSRIPIDQPGYLRSNRVCNPGIPLQWVNPGSQTPQLPRSHNFLSQQVLCPRRYVVE